MFGARLADAFGWGPGLVLAVVLSAALAAQTFWWPDYGLAGALSAQALAQGRWYALFTHMFLHAGILHLGMNLLAYSSLQAPVVMALGRSLRAQLSFAGLYLVAGLAGGLTYLALHPTGTAPMLGASGAICGLWGAASRVATREGDLTPLNDPQVFENIKRFALMNLILVGIIALPQLLSGQPVSGGIAWEGHVGGFIAGLLLAPVFQRWAGWRPPAPLQGPWVPLVR